MLLPLAPAMKLIGMLKGVPTLVAKDLHALLARTPFHFQHLPPLQAQEPRVRKVKGNGETRNAIGRKPLAGKPDVGTKPKAPLVEFVVKLVDAILQPGSFQLDAQVS